MTTALHTDMRPLGRKQVARAIVYQMGCTRDAVSSMRSWLDNELDLARCIRAFTIHLCDADLASGSYLLLREILMDNRDTVAADLLVQASLRPDFGEIDISVVETSRNGLFIASIVIVTKQDAMLEAA